MTQRLNPMIVLARSTELAACALALWLSACDPHPALHRPGRPNRATPDPVSGSTLLSASAPVVTGPAVVAFWLRAGDTLVEADRAAAWEDFRANAGGVAPFFDEHGVTFVATSVDTLFVQLPRGPRRLIMMSGLEYPYGYVFVEPGFTERILAGLYSQEELVDEGRDYFQLPDDTMSARIAGMPRHRARPGRRGRQAIFARWPQAKSRAR